MENYEGITYWQSSKPGDRMKIACKPALPDGAESSNVELDYVVGILFDEDAMMTINLFEGAYTTPLEARKMYRNVWYHWKFGAIQDYSFNQIIYYLGEGGKQP